MIIKESNITINVRNMERSIFFYQSIGFIIKQQWGNHYAQLEAAGTIIGLHPTGEKHLKGDSGNVSIGLTTDNFDDAKILLDKLYIPYSPRQEEGGDFLHFSDPDGTMLYFIKPKW